MYFWNKSILWKVSKSLKILSGWNSNIEVAKKCPSTTTISISSTQQKIMLKIIILLGNNVKINTSLVPEVKLIGGN